MHRSDRPRSARHPLRAAAMAVALTALPPAAPACRYDGLPGDEIVGHASGIAGSGVRHPRRLAQGTACSAG